MKPELFLSAMDRIDPEQLEASETRPLSAKRCRPLKLVLVAAAVVCCLAVAVTAATHGNFHTERIDGSNYEVSFEVNPAAEDAPLTIAEFYLPEVPDDFDISPDNTSLRDWVINTNWYDNSGGQIAFEQTALNAIQEMPFVNMGGLDLNELEQTVRTIDGTEVLILSAVSEYGSADWMYWVDKDNHYVFSLFCNESVTAEEQIEIFRSVHRVDKEFFRSFTTADGYDSFFTGTENP